MLVIWLKARLKEGSDEEALDKASLVSYLFSRKFGLHKRAPMGCSRREEDLLFYDLTEDRLQVFNCSSCYHSKKFEFFCRSTAKGSRRRPGREARQSLTLSSGSRGTSKCSRRKGTCLSNKFPNTARKRCAPNQANRKRY